MSLLLFLKFFHILLFVFWLGTDVAVYYSSRFVIDPKLSAPQRLTALQVLLGCDLGPRIAMTLIMPSGIHMGALLGLVQINTLGLIVLWLLSLIWLALVLKVHFSKNEIQKKKLKKLDFWIRPIIVSFVAIIAIYSLFVPTYIGATYMSWKLLIVCATILCGLAIRYHLNTFTAVFSALLAGDESEEINNAIRKSMDKCLPFVYGIWIGLLWSAALGVHLI